MMNELIHKEFFAGSIMNILRKGRPNSIAPTLLLALCALAVAQEPNPPKQDHPLIKLSLIVTDRTGHSLDDIRQDEIQIRENKVPQSISLFEKDERPVDYGIAIDASGSFRNLLGPIVSAATLLVNSKRDGNDVFIERFISHDKIETMQEFTSEKAALVKSLNLLYVEGGQSAVIDGIYLAVKHVADYQTESNRRHALVLFTDGEDRQSYYTQKQLIELIREKDVQVFVIGIVAQLDNQPRPIGVSPREKAEKLLRAVAEETGGRVFFPKKKNELEQAVAEIVHDLRFQYTIGYQSTGTDIKDNFRPVEVGIFRPSLNEKLMGVTRSGYFVNPPQSTSENTDKKKSKKPDR